jgi:hypothetical protein
MYASEQSRNSLIECTGKSLKGIWSDGIVDAIEKLCPEFSYKDDDDSTVRVNDLINYSIELANK